MNPNDTKDVPEKVHISVVTLRDPATGLPCQVLKPAFDSALRRNEPIVITLYPEDSVPAKPGPMNEDDEVLAEIITTNPGIGRKDIIRLAESNYNVIITDGTFVDRLRAGSPLKSRGYYSDSKGWYPPRCGTTE